MSSEGFMLRVEGSQMDDRECVTSVMLCTRKRANLASGDLVARTEAAITRLQRCDAMQRPGRGHIGVKTQMAWRPASQ